MSITAYAAVPVVHTPGGTPTPKRPKVPRITYTPEQFVARISQLLADVDSPAPVTDKEKDVLDALAARADHPLTLGIRSPVEPVWPNSRVIELGTARRFGKLGFKDSGPSYRGGNKLRFIGAPFTEAKALKLVNTELAKEAVWRSVQAAREIDHQRDLDTGNAIFPGGSIAYQGCGDYIIRLGDNGSRLSIARVRGVEGHVTLSITTRELSIEEARNLAAMTRMALG